MALAKWMKKYKKDAERLNTSSQQNEKKYLRRHSFHPDIMAAPPKNGNTTPGPGKPTTINSEEQTQKIASKVNISTKSRQVNSDNNHHVAYSDKKINDGLFPKTKTSSNITDAPQLRKDNATSGHSNDLESETSSSCNIKSKKASSHHRKPDFNTSSIIPNNEVISEVPPSDDNDDEEEAKDEVEEMKNSSGAVIISCQRRLSDGLMSPFKKNKNHHHYPPSSPTKSSYIQIKHHLHCGHDEKFQAQEKMVQQHQYHQGGHYVRVGVCILKIKCKYMYIFEQFNVAKSSTIGPSV